MSAMRPPSGYKNTSTLHNVQSNPTHFKDLRRTECNRCAKNNPCCENDCDIYEKSLKVYRELDLDPCGSCESHRVTCLGILGGKYTKGIDGVALKRDDFPEPEQLLNDCPF